MKRVEKAIHLYEEPKFRNLVRIACKLIDKFYFNVFEACEIVATSDKGYDFYKDCMDSHTLYKELLWVLNSYEYTGEIEW